MMQRYVCLICRRELPSQDAGCPHCKSATSSEVGASPRTLAATFVVLLVMLVTTGYLAGAFHKAEAARGRLHAGRAEALAAAGDFDGSIDEYREALTYVRDSLDYRLKLAIALYDTGRREEAETHFGELLANDPTLAEPNLYLARLAEQRDDLAQATNYYRTAIYGRWPTDPVQRRIQTRFELVGLLERRGEQAHAVAELGELLTEEPDNTVVANRVAWSLLNAGAPGAALEVFERLIGDAPADAVAHSGVAEAEFELHHYLTARTHFRRALALNPSLTHLRPRLSLTDRINELDPTIRGLGRVSRFERSLDLVEGALAVLDTCVDPDGTGAEPSPPPVPFFVDAARTMARQWLEDQPSRPEDDETTEENTILAEQLWRAARTRCPDADTPDEPLGRVLAKIASMTTQ